MKRTIIYLAATSAAAVPAVMGLWGNATFSQAVPVRVPAAAVASQHPTPSATPSSEHPTPSATPSSKTSAEPSPRARDDRGRRHGGHGTDDSAGHVSGHHSDDAADDGADRHGRGEDHSGGHGSDD